MEERRKLIATIQDAGLKEKVRELLYGKLKDSFRKTASSFEPVPKAPTSHDEIDPDKVEFEGQKGDDFVL